MTTLPRETINKVYNDEPATKNPPALAVGPLAWIKNNLFGSVVDTILTIVGSLVAVGVVTSFITWSVTWANWYVVIFNLRLFLVGRYELSAEWRIVVMTLMIAFVMGWAIAVWARLSRITVIFLAVMVGLLFVIPPLISTVLPRSPAYISAGQAEIASGTVTQVPLNRVGFIAKAGEKISVRVASEYSQSDSALANAYSFSDPATNALKNVADSRLTTEARIDLIRSQLAGDALTPNQRENLTAELEGLEVPAPITETYFINESPTTVKILDRSGETLASGELTAGSEPVDITLPEDGWYVLETSVEDPNAVTLLAAQGIYPSLERNFTRSESVDDAGEIVEAGRVTQYVRITDSFVVEQGRPRFDGEEVLYNTVVENQYRGQRALADYLSLFLGPFLALLAPGIGMIAVAAGVGYLVANLIDQAQVARDEKLQRVQDARNRLSARIVIWLLVATPVFILILIAGLAIPVADQILQVFPMLPHTLVFLPLSSPPLWGGLLLTMLLTIVGIVFSFPLGVLLALGRRSTLPVVRITSILYIELIRGVPLITLLVMGMLLVPFFAPSLSGPDTAPYRVMVAITLFSAAYLAENVRGGLQSLPPGQEEAAKALGLAAWKVTLFITLPQALRAVIPALVGQFISLFKDTSLVAIVGLIDLTNIANSVVITQNEFLGLRREAFVFISIIYFIFSYVMALISRRIEESGSGAARRI